MENTAFSGFGDLLKTLRKKRKLTQKDLAILMGVHRNTIGTWELGNFLPESKTIVLELARQLQLDTDDTRHLLEASLTALSPYWHIPYQRNPFFTGREEVLQRLHEALIQEHSAILSQSYALSGLGGIGKTQTAIEYAYRYTNDYTAIFWVEAETLESIVSSMVGIATLLNLSEKQNQDQAQILTAVMRWFSNHSNWLLIFDNVEDPPLVKRFLPSVRHASLLFTSRRQSLGFTAQTLTLEQITPEEGIHLLLHRAGLSNSITSLDQPSSTNRAQAREIVSKMDGLPLALDQAGAYIEATQCNLVDYLLIYQKYPTQLLDTRSTVADHADSVVKTVLISLKKLDHINAAAADILRICSFLSPDSIPEELFTRENSHLGPELSAIATDAYRFNQAVEAILHYSLIKRHAEHHTFSLHRLVQVVIQESMEKEMQKHWAEQVVYLLDKAFPSSDMNTWAQCQRCLSHTLISARHIEYWHMTFPTASNLLHGAAHYLHERSQYRQAEPIYHQALSIRQQGNDYADVVTTMNNLAILYKDEGKYALAEPLFQQALNTIEQHKGTTSVLFIRGLNNLGELYIDQGLNNLGELYIDQGKYDLAELLLQQAFQISENYTTEKISLYIEGSIKNLAILYSQQGRLVEATTLFQRALALNKQNHGSTHPRVALCLYHMATICHKQGDFRQSASLNRQAAILFKQAYSSQNRWVAKAISLFANLSRDQGQYSSAEIFYQKALALFKQQLGLKHPATAETLHDFARFRWIQHQIPEALSLYQQALTIREQVLGSDHPHTKATQTSYTALLNELGQISNPEQPSHSADFTIQPSTMSTEAELTGEQSRDRYPVCPTCQHNDSVVQSGINRAGTQRFRCRSCQRYFTPGAKQRGYDVAIKAQAQALTRAGVSTRDIAQRLNIHHSTVSLWAKEDQK